MRIMAVYAPIGNQPKHMQGGIIGFAVIYRIHQCRIFKESAILNLFGNPCQFLIYDTSGAHIQVPDFGIAHLPFRQPDCHSAGISFYKGIFLHQAVHYGSIRFYYRIAVFSLIQPIAVKNH